MTAGDIVAVGDHVDVTEFIRRGDTKDTEVRNGWVAGLTETVITVSVSPDWESEPDPWLVDFPLTGRDRVVVTLDRTKARTHA